MLQPPARAAAPARSTVRNCDDAGGPLPGIVRVGPPPPRAGPPGTLVALAAEHLSVRSIISAVRRRAGARIKGSATSAGQHITLEYPVEPSPRWGYDRPPHPELEALIEKG